MKRYAMFILNLLIVSSVVAQPSAQWSYSEGSQGIIDGAEYENFQFSCEIKTTDKAKGFIYFHTDKDLSKGYRVVIDNDPDDAVWWRKSGSLFGVRNITKRYVKDDEWYTLKIQVVGQSIMVFVNDYLVVDYIEPLNPYRTEENRNMKVSSGSFAIANSGHGTIHCRNVRIDHLPGINKHAQIDPTIDEQADDIMQLHQADFPVLDYHVHLKGGFTKEAAAIQSRKFGINYTLAPNAGKNFPITTDDQLLKYLEDMAAEPFHFALQAEGREWLGMFTPEVYNRFDWVFTDGLTFTDNEGRRSRIWIDEETWIYDDTEAYMDMLVDRICQVIREPVQVYVNSCFLPEALMPRYDELWTDARIDRVVAALVEQGVAMELNELYNIPNENIVRKAKAAGVKFTFGTNNVTPEVGKLEHGIRMMKVCGLTAGDMYKPDFKL